MPEPALLQSRDELWAAIHAERAKLADDLAQLDDDRWATPSLCGRWTVEQVVAHLTAAASTGGFRWFRSVLGARFDFDLHNDRRLAERRGATPSETLDRFRAAIPNTTAASGHIPAWLGEVVVHAQDIRRPLGIDCTPAVNALTTVATFYASSDFTVASKTATSGARAGSHRRTIPARRRSARARYDRRPDDGHGQARDLLRRTGRPRRPGPACPLPSEGQVAAAGRCGPARRRSVAAGTCTARLVTVELAKDDGRVSALWTAVQAVVDAEDPEGLLAAGAPADEYSVEVPDLVQLVSEQRVTAAGVLAVWEHWFGPESSLKRRADALERLTEGLSRMSPASDDRGTR